MSLGDVVDEFLDQHGLANTSTSEETDFSTTGVRSEEIDDLDTGFEHLSGCRLVDEWRRIGVNGKHLGAFDGTTLVDGFANDVHDPTQSCGTDGDHDGCASVDDLLTTNETFCTVHGNGADGVFTQVRRDLKNETTTVEVLNLESIEDGREVVGIELDVYDGTNDGFH